MSLDSSDDGYKKRWYLGPSDNPWNVFIVSRRPLQVSSRYSSRVDSQRLGRSDPALAIAHKSRGGAPPRFYGSEQRRVYSTNGGSKPPASAEGILSHPTTALSSTAKYCSLTLCVEDLRCSFKPAELAGGSLNPREHATRASSTIYCLFPKHFNFPRVDHIAWLHDATSVPLRLKYSHYETECRIDTGIRWVDQRIWSRRQRHHRKAQSVNDVDKMKKGGYWATKRHVQRFARRRGV